MAEAPAGDGTAEGGGDMVLHQEIGEAPWAVAACESDGHGDTTCGRTGEEREVPQATRSDTGHRLALLPARS